MKPSLLMVWLLLTLTALGHRLVEAGEMEPPSGAFRSEPGVAYAVGDPQAAMPPLLAQGASVRAEAVGPASLPPPLPPAQQPQFQAGLTLEELNDIALASNPTLVQARMAVRAARGRYLQAGLYPNPVIGYEGADIGLDDASGVHGAFVGQEIVTRGKLRLGRAVAGHEIEQARHVLELQRRRILNDVCVGYYEVLLAQRMVEVNEQLVHIGEEGVKTTERLRTAMEVSRADVLQASIEAETAKLSLIEARNHRFAVWRQLAAVLGQPDMEPADLAGDVTKNLPELNREDALRQILAQSPELAQARSAVEHARCQLALQQAERVPNFGIGTAAKHDTAARYTIADVEISLPLPLFNRNQGNIVSAHANLIAARREVQRIELELQARFAAAFEQYANAQRQVETYAGTILPNAKASLDLVWSGYREGEFGYLPLLTAQRTYFGVNLDYLASLSKLWTQSTLLEGLLLRGGLGRPE